MIGSSGRLDGEPDSSRVYYGSFRRRESAPPASVSNTLMNRPRGHHHPHHGGSLISNAGKYTSIPHHGRTGITPMNQDDRGSSSDNDSDDGSITTDSEKDLNALHSGRTLQGSSLIDPRPRSTGSYKRVLRIYGLSGQPGNEGNNKMVTSTLGGQPKSHLHEDDVSTTLGRLGRSMDDHHRGLPASGSGGSSVPEAPPPYHQITNLYGSQRISGGQNNLNVNSSSSAHSPGNIYQELAAQNSTTGPLVPLPNHVHPSQHLESSDAPPQVLRPNHGTNSIFSSAGHHGYPGQEQHSSAASSALAALRVSRFNLNWSKGCSSSERQPCLWRMATLLLVLLCLTLLSIVAYKQASTESSTFNPDDGKPCIVVEESSNQDKLSSLATSSSGNEGRQSVHNYDPLGIGRSTSNNQRSSTVNKSISSTSISSASPSTSSLNSNNSNKNKPSKSVKGNDDRLSSESSSDYSSSSSRQPGALPLTFVNLPQEMSLYTEIKLVNKFTLITQRMAPHSTWTSLIHHNKATFVRFLFLSLPIWSRFALFVRRTEPPTLTRYDYMEIISPKAVHVKNKRTSDRPMGKNELSSEVLEFLEPGTWYITLVNDADEGIALDLNVSSADDIPTSCPNNCNGHGKCHQGKCLCFPGFIGHDCVDSVCPILCSGHGRFLGGRCHCEIGWKGSECNIRSSDCEVSDCNGHGRCNNGVCHCLPGFKGENCETADCLDPSCSSHGACIDGTCWCKMGWKGVNCSQIDHRLNKFFPHCNTRGVYDLDLEKCACFPGWLGDDCSIAKCDLDCGSHGICEGGSCVCDPGWEGANCERLSCDPRCLEHGQCSNGTCVCVEGWMGKHCTFNGCANGCSNHGLCAKDTDMDRELTWRCICREGWTGKDCSHPLETNCADDVDNDHDGLIDCADSECCSTEECKDSLMCLRSPDPLDILLRKSPPSVTASFYQKMKFLIEEGSVQSYAHRDDYSESRVSVIRGQVITPDGNGLTGIRISVATDPQFGFTLTRPDGWFDILVNGGNMVTLQFQRSPFHPIKRTIMVPWNEIIVIQNSIVMSANSEDSYSTDPSLTDLTSFGSSFELTETLASTGNQTKSLQCWDHNYNLMKPILFQTLKPDAEGGCTESSAVIAESQVLLETLSIPGSTLKLVYQSSSSPGYLATINLQLTPDSIPRSLKVVHLRIVLEGNLFSRLFDAESSIKYTFSWNKRNVYRQKVYGLTTARVYVGYQYESCSQVIWSTLTTSIRGFDMEISELASWNLDIHHRYNYHEGVLQKGDGSAIFFKQQTRVASTLIGTRGDSRPLVCKARDCEGQAKTNKLLSPITLTSGPDGSVYVGDANLVRRIKPDGYVYTIFKHSDKGANLRGSMSNNPTTYNYHIHLSSYDGHLYISDPERHQILRVHTVDRVDDPESNYDVFVGSGSRCLPRDTSNCGDGGSALEASLVFPKGMAFGLDGSLYFADGSVIRVVNWKGIISTIIGDNHYHRKRQWKPIPCGGSLPADEVKLRWPTEIAIHPIDGSLYFLDDQMVFRLTPDRRVLVVVGSPSYCDKPFPASSTASTGDSVILTFSFSSTGDLFVASIGKDGSNTVNLINKNGDYVHFMGLDKSTRNFAFSGLLDLTHSSGSTFCEIETCKDLAAHNCTCAIPASLSTSSQSTTHTSSSQPRIALARDTPLVSITAITITSDGVVHVADEGTYQIISAIPYIPGPDESLQFTIASPETNEIYIFNKYGQHISTRNALTGQSLHTFLYDVNTSFGKLTAVTDSSGSKVSFLRDSINSLHSIETAIGQKCRITVNNQGLLETFNDPDNLTLRFTYDSATGLLVSRSDSAGYCYFYQYSSSGRLNGLVKPSGSLTSISFDFNHDGSYLKARTSPLNLDSTSRSVRDNLIVQIIGDSALVLHSGNQFKVTLHEDKSIALITPWRQGIFWEASPHKVLLQTVPVQAGMFPVLNRQVNFALRSPSPSSPQSTSPFDLFPSSIIPSSLASISWDFNVKGTGRNGSNGMPGLAYPSASSVGSTATSAGASTQAASSAAMNGPGSGVILGSNILAVERVLYINETRYLSLEYDRNANREILYNNSRRPFLVVQYDNSSRPIQWLPTETRLPLNVIYDRYGRLAGWQQGSLVSETFLYDRNGLLSEVRYPDSTSTKYGYDDSGRSQPVRVTLRSGKQYHYHYDERSGLKRIVTPRRNEHRTNLIISLGFYKLQYFPPGYSRNSAYTLYFDDNLKPLMEISPDDSSRVVYIYNERSKLSEIVYGGGKVTKTYASSWKPSSSSKQNPHRAASSTEGSSTSSGDGLLTSETWSEGSNEVTLQYGYVNSLITRISLRVTSVYSHLSNFEYTYEYDEFGRKKSIGARIISSSASPSVSLPAHETLYNPRTGRLEVIGHFRVHDHHDYQHHQNESLVTDGVATFSKIYDSSTHQLRQLSLTVKEKEVYRMDLLYNPNGAIITTKTFMRHLGASKVRVSNYTYDYDEQLIEVSGRDQWKFTYDDNGNLVTLQYMGNRIDIAYDAGDRVVRFGDTPYTTDGRGYFITKGEERLIYNTAGLLLRAYRPGRYDIRYLYDPRGRLTIRKDNFGNLTQYFYGDIERPYLVTHMFNNADGTITSMIYDDTGMPLSVQINHQTFYITCDQVGSPLLVFDHRGDVIKEIHRGPYGHVLFDSNPTFYLPIGFHGGLSDPVTGILHFHGHYIYDSLIGQWLTPHWSGVLSNLKNPLALNLYRFSQNDPVNPEPGMAEGRSTKLNLNRWIQHQGIDLTGFDIGGQRLINRGSSLAFQGNQGSTIRSTLALGSLSSAYGSYSTGESAVPSPTAATSPYLHYNTFDAFVHIPSVIVSSLVLPTMPILSAFWCAVQRNTRNFAVSSFIRRSKVKSEELLENSRITKIATESRPFGYGITLSSIDGKVMIMSSPDADPIRRDVFTKVFNNSHLLDIHLIFKGSDAFYFVKPNLWKAREDQIQLQRLGNSINVTTNDSIKDHDGDSKAGHKNHQADIRIHVKGAILNIRYGTTVERERNRVLRHAKKHAVNERWSKEADLTRNNRLIEGDSVSPLHHSWNDTEKELLLSTGSVAGYRGEYYHPINKYPQLADDPSNIYFTNRPNKV
ncbi:teneurin-m-like isoform X2 [Tetranychus urticae]|uniref:teneurin-m-like isoform X2 n=1 Tax=Tetranychus urticae TaxID=32264 RepID=UPI00077BE2E0|nr:teneurin-m-like isoform X2 [Tetranychus urticae]